MASAMQLTVKALQGRECSLQVASPGPRREPACSRSPPLVRRRTGVRVGTGLAGQPLRESRESCPQPRGCRLNPCSHPRPDQVSEDELVSTLKHLVSEKLNVPVRQQRLLFKGKALAGNARRGDAQGAPHEVGVGVSRPS